MSTTKTVNKSSSIISINGDIDPGRGQFGLTADITYDTDANTVNRKRLWNTELGDAKAVSKYLINADNQSGTKEVYLPDVGSTFAQAAPGHTLTIVNTGSVSFLINNDAGSLVMTLEPDSYVTLLADPNASLDWRSIVDDPRYISTLQTSYNASSGAPLITLDTVRSGLSIVNDSANTAQTLLSLSTNNSAKNYLALHNVVTGTTNNGMLTGLGNTDTLSRGILTTANAALALGEGSGATGTNSFAFGIGTSANQNNAIAIGQYAGAEGRGIAIGGSATKGNGATIYAFARVSSLTINTAESSGNYENAGTGRYYTLASPTHNYYLWFSTDGASTDPLIASRIGIKVTIASGASQNTIASAVNTVINTIPDLSSTVLGAVVTITRFNGSAVSRAVDADGNLGALVTITTINGGLGILDAIAIGTSAHAGAPAAIAMGSGAVSNSDQGIAIGYATSVSTDSNRSVAIGYMSTDTGIGNSVTLGIECTTSSVEAVTIGRSGTSSGYRAINLGYNNTCSAERSRAIGNNVTNAQIGSMVLTDGNAAFTAQDAGTIVKRFEGGERLIGGSTHPASGVDSSPSMRWLQVSASSTGNTENLIMTITLPSDTMAGIEYRLTGIVKTVGDSSPAYTAGQSWFATILIKAKYDGTDTTVFGDGDVAGDPGTPEEHKQGDAANTTYTVRGTSGAGTVRLYATNVDGGTTGVVYWTITASVCEVSSTLTF